MNFFQRFFHRPFFIRLFHWEYWSMNTVYFLIYPVFVYLVIRSGFRFFFTAANPRIRYGGFLMESKKEIYDTLPASHSPRTLLFHPGADIQEINTEIRQAGLAFPLIIKPDIGMRGMAVKKVQDEKELEQVVRVFDIDFLVQAFVPYEKEAGIFYYRMPGEERGGISGIVAKEFLTITGNGQNTTGELLKKDKRFLLQWSSLEQEYGEELNRIPAAGETILLVPYGNHARGAKFLDHTNLVTPELEKVIDDFCRQVPDFFYGRLDIRYEDWDTFIRDKKFCVIELNGAGSEPTHMYDPAHSLFFAWKEIIRHWFILFRISRANKRRGHSYMRLAEARQMFKDNGRYVKKLEALHERLLGL